MVTPLANVCPAPKVSAPSLGATCGAGPSAAGASPVWICAPQATAASSAQPTSKSLGVRAGAIVLLQSQGFFGRSAYVDRHPLWLSGRARTSIIAVLTRTWGTPVADPRPEGNRSDSRYGICH